MRNVRIIIRCKSKDMPHIMQANFVNAAFCTSKHPTTVKNTRQIITIIPKHLHNSNKSRTFATLEPPSLLTMLDRRQTESNVKLVWTLPRCEGGRALLKLKSGVVLFLYHYEIIVRQVFYAA